VDSGFLLRVRSIRLLLLLLLLSENTTSIVMSIARTFQFGLCAACGFNSKGLPFHCNRFVQNNMDQLLHLASVAMLPISWYNPDPGLMGDL